MGDVYSLWAISPARREAEPIQLMDKGTNDPISVCLIWGTLLYLLALGFVSHFRYKKFLTAIKKSNSIDPTIIEDYENESGGFIGGKFYGRMPFPIMLNSNDLSVVRAVERYNNSVKLWWLSCLILLPTVIVILNIRGK